MRNTAKATVASDSKISKTRCHIQGKGKIRTGDLKMWTLFPQWSRRGGVRLFWGQNFLLVFLASYGLLTCIGVGENANYHLERPIRIPNPSLF